MSYVLMCDREARRGLMDASAFILLLITVSGIATLLRGTTTYPTVMIGVLMGAMGAAATVVVVIFRVVFFGFPFTCCGLLEEDEEEDVGPRPILPSPPSSPSPPPPPSHPSSPRASMRSMEVVATTHL